MRKQIVIDLSFFFAEGDDQALALSRVRKSVADAISAVTVHVPELVGSAIDTIDTPTRKLVSHEWAQDDKYKAEDWRHHVATESTNLGYWEWADTKRAAARLQKQTEPIPPCE